MVYISHRLHEVKDITNRVAILREGVIVDIQKSAQTTTERMADAMVGRGVPRGQRRTAHNPAGVLSAKSPGGAAVCTEGPRRARGPRVGEGKHRGQANQEAQGVGRQGRFEQELRRR